ncbi:MAG: hypothetical protein GY754_22470 [bacterium]|nr:hypothetical protein [bacterium]
MMKIVYCLIILVSFINCTPGCFINHNNKEGSMLLQIDAKSTVEYFVVADVKDFVRSDDGITSPSVVRQNCSINLTNCSNVNSNKKLNDFEIRFSCDEYSNSFEINKKYLLAVSKDKCIGYFLISGNNSIKTPDNKEHQLDTFVNSHSGKALPDYWGVSDAVVSPGTVPDDLPGTFDNGKLLH